MTQHHHNFNDRDDNATSQRQILILFLPFAGTAVSLSYALLFEFFFKYHLASAIVTIFAFLYFCSLILFKYKHYLIGKHFLTLIFLFEIAINSFYLFPSEAYFHLYFLVGMPLIYMLYNQHQHRTRLFYSLLSVTLLFVVELADFGFTPPFVITADQLSIINNGNIITSVLVLSITIYLFTNMMEQAEEKAYQHSITDHLTGIYNRRHFYYLAQQLFDSTHKSHTTMSASLVHIDHFKEINAHYGHYISDQVLLKITQIIKSHIRPSDIFAKMGGEVLVIIFDHTNAKHAHKILEEIRHTIAQEDIPLTQEHLTISIGLTEICANDSSINNLLKRADSALSEAIGNGENCSVTHLSSVEN